MPEIDDYFGWPSHKEIKTKTDIWRKLAQIKIFKDRATSWLALLNALQISILFLEGGKPWKIYLFIISFIGIVVLSWIDYKKILPHEQGYMLEQNLEWKKQKGVEK